jgi:hypothetical protein
MFIIGEHDMLHDGLGKAGQMAARFLYLYLPLSLVALLGLADSAPLVQPAAKSGSASAVWASATSRWRIVQTFGLVGGSSSVTSVAATSTRNAWATALVCGPQSCGPASLLVEHWGGSRWRRVPSPPGPATYVDDALVSGNSAANAWVFTNSNAGSYTRALEWNDSRWADFRFPNWSSINAAAVFSRTDTWAFGEIEKDLLLPYVVRFNGRQWRRVSSPVIPQAASALAPDDIWTVGPMTKPSAGFALAAAHWNGQSWRTLKFPPTPLPPGVSTDPGGIVALSARDVWADLGLSTDTNTYPGIILLHWNGKRWTRVKVPYATSLVGDITGNGRSGIWIFAAGPAPSLLTYLYNLRKGRWARQQVPAKRDNFTALGEFSWAQGADSGWAASDMSPGATSQGVLLRYGR